MVSRLGVEFDRTVRWLKQFAQFRVRTADCHDFAVVRETPQGWLVTVDRNQGLDSAIDCLIHEVAHILDWEKNGYQESHDDQHRRSWGVIYSDLYRRYHSACEQGEL